MSNRLCNGLVKNNNPKSPIQYFELVTVREYDDYEDSWGAVDEPFYRIYGKRYADDVISGPIFLGEFYNINDAKQFIYYLTGEIPVIISY